MPNTHRTQKLASILHEEAAKFVERHALLPTDALLTVTRVSMRDLDTQADIYISLFPTDRIGAVLKELRVLEGQFRDHLKKTLRMRKVPHVSFVFDDTELKRERLEKLLKTSENNDVGA